DVVLRDRPEGRVVGEPQLLLETCPRVRREPLGRPGDRVRVGDAEELHDLGVGEEDELDAVDDPTVRPHRFDDGARDVDQRLVVHWVGGIEVYAAPNAVGGPVGRAGDDHTAVAAA